MNTFQLIAFLLSIFNIAALMVSNANNNNRNDNINDNQVNSCFIEKIVIYYNIKYLKCHQKMIDLDIDSKELLIQGCFKFKDQYCVGYFQLFCFDRWPNQGEHIYIYIYTIRIKKYILVEWQRERQQRG